MSKQKQPTAIRLIAGLIVAALVALGYVKLGDGDENTASDSTVTQPPTSQGQAGDTRTLLVRGPNGSTDLAPTLERIERGEEHAHRNDGAVFQNRERRLPQKPRGYYREYVHPTPGESGPGAQRVVIGAEGDVWYTPDHYASFQRVSWTFEGQVPR